MLQLQLDRMTVRPQPQLDVVPPPSMEPETPPPLLFASTPKSPIVLNGIHISTHCQTEERLTVQVFDLEPEPFRDLGFAIEDWIGRIDEKHMIKRRRGRGWKGRGAKFAKEIDETDMQSRKRVLGFSPFPSTFSNTLKAIRAELYNALRRHCFVLETEVKGEGGKRVGYRQNFYILPYANAPNMMVEIGELNKIVDGLNVKIQEFVKTEDFMQVHNILQHFHRADVLENQYWSIAHITADLTPLAFDPQTVKDSVNQEYHRVFAEIDQLDAEKRAELEEKYRVGEQSLYDEIERKRQEMISGTLNHLKQELENITKKMVGQRRRTPEAIKKDLELLRSKAASVGFEALAETVIRPLEVIVDNPDKAMELFGSSIKDLPTTINNRVAGLIETL